MSYRRSLHYLLDSFRRVRERRWLLAVYQLAAAAAATLLLAPALSGTFRFFVSSTGKNVLSDTEIIHFLLGWEGLVAILTLGALGALVNAVTLIGFMGILGTPTSDRADGGGAPIRQAIGTLGAVVARAPALALQFAIVVAALIAVFIPSLAIVAVVMRPVLTGFDINYYLAALPPDFVVAVGAGAVALLISLACAVYLLVHWSLAIPLLLFEDRSAWGSLIASRRMVSARRREVVHSLLLWGAAWIGAVAIADLVLGWIGSLAISAVGDLGATIAATGALLGIGIVAGLALSFLGLAVLAGLLLRLYAAASGHSPRFAPPATAPRLRTIDRNPRLVYGAVIALLFGFGFLLSWSLLHDVDLDYRPLVIAHRGSSSEAPENTLSAIDLAYRQGADLVEIDVQLGADGSVLVIHDADLKRVADSASRVAELTAASLVGIDVGGWFGDQFTGEPLPTLRQVLEKVPGHGRLLIELKHDHGNGDLERQTLAAVAAAGLADRVEYMSLEYRRIQRLATADPNPPTGFVSNISVGDLTDSNADFFAVSARAASRDFVRRAHSHGKKVYVWTVNTPREMALFVDRGVDGIITDNPSLLRKVLAELDDFAAAERLLLRVSHETGLTLEGAPL